MYDVHVGVVFRGIRFRYLYSVCFVIILYAYGMSNYILMVQFNLLPLPFILCVWNRQYSLYRAKNCNIIIYADMCDPC